jgi:hypothetical protein
MSTGVSTWTARIFFALLLLMSSCSMVFTDSNRTLAVIPAKTMLPAVCRISLSEDCQSIQFICANDFRMEDQELKLSVINIGASGFLLRNSDGEMVVLKPDASVVVYTGYASGLTKKLYIPVIGIEDRTPCEVRVESTSTDTLHSEVSIFCKISTPSF